MKISEFLETPSLGNEDYVPISRKVGADWMSVKYKLSSIFDKIGFNTNTNKFAESVLPNIEITDISEITEERLPYDDANFASKLLSKTLLPKLFDKALNANQSIHNGASWAYSDVTDKSCESVVGCGKYLRANGYYPDVNPYTPYYIFGLWVREDVVWAMLFDKYTPYMGGGTCSSWVNLPIRVKSTDTRLILDYACCNNYIHRVMTLSNEGWNGSVYPTSCFRAFHGCGKLYAVIGEISLEYINKQSDITKMFGDCPQLWQFHLANIPDAITTLDLSKCSVDIVKPFVWTTSTSEDVCMFTSSFAYLLNNIERDIKRTTILNIKLSSAQYEVAWQVYDNFRGNKDHITLIESA